MRQASVYVDKQFAGILTETDNKHYVFEYDEIYHGAPVSLTMPLVQKRFEYSHFPAFFDGVLPEGIMLAALLKLDKLDAHDYFGQLIAVGNDLVGSVSVHEYQKS